MEEMEVEAEMENPGVESFHVEELEELQMGVSRVGEEGGGSEGQSGESQMELVCQFRHHKSQLFSLTSMT